MIMSGQQGDLFAQQAADKGIERSINNANKKIDGWADIAFGFLENYIKQHSEFMTEQMRNASIGTVPEPPSNRSWGGVIRRAAKEGKIFRKGFQNTTNENSHGTPATLWEVRKFEETGRSII